MKRCNVRSRRREARRVRPGEGRPVIRPVAAVACALALLATIASAAEWKSLKPAAHGGVTKISLGGKELTYYRFSDSDPLSFSIDGPTRVKILTRVRIPNEAGTVDYSVDVARDGYPMETVDKEAYPKEGAFYVSSDQFRPGVIRRIYIDVPTGRHGYELTAVGGVVVDARVFESTAAKPSLVSLAPRTFDSVETLHYLVKKGKPVVLDVVGPTTVKVNTRLLYDSTMLGDQTYVIGVAEAGSPESLYRVDAEPSQTVVCRDRSDVIPGELRYFTLEIPKGAHAYTFRLVDAVAGGVAIKFYIPRGDLTNEP
jgi:hypothetical protein